MKDDPAGALLFFAAARALRESIGAPLEPADEEKLQAVLGQIRAALGAEAAAKAETAGREMSLDDVLDHAATAFG